MMTPDNGCEGDYPGQGLNQDQFLSIEKESSLKGPIISNDL